MSALEFRAWKSMKAFGGVPLKEQLVVFYAQDPGEWSHLGPIIQRLTTSLNRPTCYLTADPDDPMLARKHQNLRTFFCGRGMTRRRVFTNLRTNVLVMAAPHLGTAAIPKPRSKKLHNVFLVPTLNSAHTNFTPKELKPYDSILCAGPHHVAELREMLGPRPNLIEHGSTALDQLMELAERRPPASAAVAQRQVLIVPEYPQLIQDHGETIVQSLLEGNFWVTIHLPSRLLGRGKILKSINRRFSGDPLYRVDETTGILPLLAQANVVITDVSEAAIHFAIGMQRPPVFIDLNRPVECRHELATRRPIEVGLRTRLGELVRPDRIGDIGKICRLLCEQPQMHAERLEPLREATVFHLGLSCAMGAAAIEALITGLNPQEALRRAIEELRKSDPKATRIRTNSF